MSDLNPQEFDGTNMNPQEFDGTNMDPPEPLDPDPEDDPDGYADYLRRKVVAMARRYFVEHGYEELEVKATYAGLPIERSKATIEDIMVAIKRLDDWKREFKLKDID